MAEAGARAFGMCIAMTGLVTALVGVSAEARAQARRETAAPPVSQASVRGETYAFEIPAKRLLSALADFTAMTGIQVLHPDPEALSGTSQAVSGNFTAEEALRRLLAGTGIGFRMTAGNAVVLQRGSGAEAVPTSPPDATGLQAPSSPTRARGLAQAPPASRPAEQPAGAPPSGEAAPTDVSLPGVTIQALFDQPYNPQESTVGTKIDLPLRDIPQSIEIVPRQVMDDQRAITLSDVLRNVSGFAPGVTSQSQRFGDRNVIFRGFAGNNYYTNGYKDPFNGTSFTFALANIEQVEVLKGPSSVLYGQGDPGGTVNVVTKQPLADWYASGSVTAGSYGFVIPTFDVTGPLTPGKELRFRLSGDYQSQDSFVDFVKSQRYLVAPVLSLSLGADTLLTLEGSYQALSEIYYTGLPAAGTIQKNVNGEIPLSRYLGDAQLEGYGFPERTLGNIGYRLQHRFNDIVSLRNGFRATLFTIDERDVIPGTLLADQKTLTRSLFVANSSWEDYYALTELTFDFKTGPFTHKLLVGSDQRGLSMLSRSATAPIASINVFAPTYGGLIDPIGPGSPRTVFNQTGTFIGAYLQDFVSITDQVKVLVGGRYDFADQDTSSRNTGTGSVTKSSFDDNVFTPRAGIVYQPVYPVSLYGNYTTSFTPVAGTTFEGNAFEPLRGVQYEAGVKLSLFGGKLTSTMAGYQITMENVLTPDPAHPGFSVQVGEQRSRGAEVDVAGEILPGFQVIASYAYTDAVIVKSNSGTQGNTPVNVPRHTASVWGTYQFRSGLLQGLGFGLGVIAVGERPADNANTATLPAYARTDAAIYYRPWKFLELAVNIKNLFNITYFEASTFGNVNNGISPGPPISVFGTVTARY